MGEEGKGMKAKKPDLSGLLHGLHIKMNHANRATIGVSR